MSIGYYGFSRILISLFPVQNIVYLIDVYFRVVIRGFMKQLFTMLIMVLMGSNLFAGDFRAFTAVDGRVIEGRFKQGKTVPTKN